MRTAEPETMLIGLVFALLAVACGLAINRALRTPLSLGPLSGLGGMAVLTVWCSALGAPPFLGTSLVLLVALVGVARTLRALRAGQGGVGPRSDARRAGLIPRDSVSVNEGDGAANERAQRRGLPLSWLHQRWASAFACRAPLFVLAAAAVIPLVLLGTALAGVDAPVSTHDGAFHVETIDSLRQGVLVQMWYPIGFHTTAAAVLGLVPWLDSARGTIDVALGLAMLAPLGLFALGLSLRLRPLEASVGAVVLALTYVFPYDDHLWGGWPLAMSMVLLLGLWAVAAQWTAQPSARLAILGGLLSGTIVVTHATEVYGAVVGLAIIAAIRWRTIQLGQLARHLPLAGACALLCALPYLSQLLGWQAGGGAGSSGVAALDDIATHPELGSGGDWLEFVLGVTGASSIVDLPLRAILLGIGTRGRHMRVVVAAWAAFAAVLFGVSFVNVGPIRWLYVATFPWLVHHRPPQLVALFASLLVASGLATLAHWLWLLRPRLAAHPRLWRRLAIVSGIALAFFAEGSAISIHKTLDQVIAEQNAYAPDDRAAMAWLKQHAQPGQLVVNDQAADAGIWAPYKAGLAILLPRSAVSPLLAARVPVLTHVLDLNSAPEARAEACGLNVGYVYSGARSVPGDEHVLPDRAALDQAPNLEQVFSSGQAAVFRVDLACG